MGAVHKGLFGADNEGKKRKPYPKRGRNEYYLYKYGDQRGKKRVAKDEKDNNTNKKLLLTTN